MYLAEQSGNKRRFYRPQLDVVRFLAFLAVFGHHILPRTGEHNVLLKICANAMGFGLSLFFCPQRLPHHTTADFRARKTGEIHLLPFYMRRVLRIWPLYLLGLGIGVVRAVNHGVFLQQKSWLSQPCCFREI